MRRDRTGQQTRTERQRADERPNVLPDPLGRAMLAHHRDEPGRLTYRDGTDVQDGNVAEFYFSPPASWSRETIDCLETVADRDSVLDAGCGSGNHLLWFEDRDVEAVGVDASPNAVRTARERGVEDLLVGDMFDLPVPTSAFGAVHCVGTQLGLGGSLAGIRDLLAELARVTTDHGVAVVDNYDPTRLGEDFFGYRPDPREGIAHRCFHLEFERERADGRLERAVGRTLHFLLCSPARLEEATGDTRWTLTDVRYSDPDGAHYVATLAAE